MNRDDAGRDRFFIAFASAMLLIVLAGFARTFFARSHFGTLDLLATPDLPVHLQVHGIILTTWFVLFLAQTLLVATDRTAIHRRLGIAGVVLAALVVVSGLITVAEFVPRATLAKLPIEAVNPTVFGNSASLAAFALCFLRGVLHRSEPAVHRRMMAIASSNIAVQAGARVGELFGLSKIALGPPTFVALFLAMVAYDLIAERRVHPATIWGGIVSLLCVAAFVILGNSALGDAIVEFLRSRGPGA